MDPRAGEFKPGRNSRPQHVKTSAPVAAGQPRHPRSNPPFNVTRKDSSNGSQSATSTKFHGDQDTDTSSDDTMSQVSRVSNISPHYLTQHPEQKGKSQVFQQGSHPGSFKRVTMDVSLPVEESFPGAYELVKSLNPDYYSMPYGTQVINIKTEFVTNIQYAARTGMYSTIEKSSMRIMEVWDARKDPREKILFLFAVSGSGRFCALAEMSGPWDPNGHIECWQETDSGAGSVGTIPLTWVYIKNVPYKQFDGVKQGENNHSVANMWNGMRFQTDAGRRVIEIYVRYTHNDNILAWPKHGNHNRPLSKGAQKKLNGGNQSKNPAVENVRAIRGGRGELNGQMGQKGQSGGGGQNAAFTSQNWRQVPAQQQGGGKILGEVEDDEPTPSASRLKGLGVNTSAPPPHFDGSAEAAAAPPTPQIIPCVIDEHGNLVPISPHPQQMHTFAHMPLQQSLREQPLNLNDIPHPQQTHAFTHMPSRQSFHDQPVNLNDIPHQGNQPYRIGGFGGRARGGFRGGARGGMRGDTRGATSQNARGGHGQQTSTYLSPHMDGSHESQRSLRHAASAANFGPQQATMADPFGAARGAYGQQTATYANPNMNGSHEVQHPLHHAASAANLRPQQANMAGPSSAPMLYHAASMASMPHAQHSQMLRNAASNANFTQQGHHGGQFGNAFNNQPKPSPPPSFLGSEWTAIVHNGKHIGWGQRPQPSQANKSEDSYVKAFGEHDSMAGFDYRMPPPPKVEQTPTHAPATRQGMLQQTMQMWDETTPTQKNFAYPLPIDGDGIPPEKRPSYFRLMAQKLTVEKKLANFPGEGDRIAWCDLKANLAELDNQLTKLTMDDTYSDFHADGSPRRRATRGSSEADSSIQETSSVERHNISPVRAKDGRVLHSASKQNSIQGSRQGSPARRPTRKGNRARNSPYTESHAARIKDSVDGLVETPTSSAQGNFHSSPPAQSVTVETAASEATNPYSDNDVQSEGDGSGGCRLES